MRGFLHFSFLVPASLFTLHQVALSFGLNISFLENYLDPFCFAAMMLTVFFWQLKKRFDHGHVSIEIVLAFVALLALFSEVIFPLIQPKFTSDIYDVVSIFMGGLWYLKTNPEDKVEESISQQTNL